MRELRAAQLLLNFKMEIDKIIAILLVLSCNNVAFGIDSKTGDTRLIRTKQDLVDICKNPRGQFELKNDIFLDTTESWTPCDFYGKLLGNGYSINGLRVNSIIDTPVGLFSKIIPDPKEKCSETYWAKGRWRTECALEGKHWPGVFSLTIRNARVDGMQEAGILAGKIFHANIENISVDGDLRGGTGVGMIAGRAGAYSTFSNCSAKGSILAKSEVGGLVGSLFFGQITNSKSFSSISGQNNVGGIVGKSASSIISEVESDGKINGKDSIGGIIGAFFGSNNGSTYESERGFYWVGDEQWLSSLKSDELSFPALNSNSILLDGEKHKYRGYTSSNEPDGRLPYFQFWRGKFGDSRFSQRAESNYISNSNKLVDSSNIESGLTIESRAFQASSKSVISCNSFCGGIIGAIANDVVSVSHIIHSGLIYGKAGVGQFFGTGLPLVRPINYVASGYVLSPTQSKRLFGKFPEKIGWIIDLTPPSIGVNESQKQTLGIQSHSRIAQGSNSVKWPGAFYPSGIFSLKQRPDSTLEFERVKTNDIIGDCLFTFNNIWYEGAFGKCDDIVPNHKNGNIRIGMEFSTFAIHFPPIASRAPQKLQANECMDLRKIFDVDKTDAVAFSTFKETRGWRLSETLLCRDSVLTESPIYVKVKFNKEPKTGQTWTAIYPAIKGVDKQKSQNP